MKLFAEWSECSILNNALVLKCKIDLMNVKIPVPDFDTINKLQELLEDVPFSYAQYARYYLFMHLDNFIVDIYIMNTYDCDYPDAIEQNENDKDYGLYFTYDDSSISYEYIKHAMITFPDEYLPKTRYVVVPDNITKYSWWLSIDKESKEKALRQIAWEYLKDTLPITGLKIAYE